MCALFEHRLLFRIFHINLRTFQNLQRNSTIRIISQERSSTRFTDGGEFGLGCEMGISTQKLHARGPMGLRELTSYKYVVRGSGQIR